MYTNYKYTKFRDITSPWEFRWVIENVFNISNVEDFVETLNQEYLFYGGYKIVIENDENETEKSYDYV